MIEFIDAPWQIVYSHNILIH